METLDIGLAHPTLTEPRGAEKQLCMLAFYLSKFGHEVTLYTLEKNKPYIFDYLLEKVSVVSPKGKVKFNTYYSIYNFYIMKMIVDINKVKRPHDIMNVHNYPMNWLSSFIQEPTIWTCNEPPIWVYENWSVIKRSPILFHILIDRLFTSRVDLITCLDARMQKIISRGYPKKPITVIGSGAGLGQKIHHVDNRYFDILFVGALGSQKRPVDILKTAQLLNSSIDHIRVHMVGDGKLKSDLQNTAKKYGIDTIFYGNVSDEKLYELYSIADLSLFLSENQPWGIFPLESILSGIPTVISNQCGVVDILKNHVPIVDVGDVDTAARYTLDIYNNYSQYKNKISSVKKYIKKNYSWEAYARRMFSVFKSVLNQ